MNLIDRDKLIEDLLNQDENNIYVPWAMIKGFINDYVMKQPTVNQWIPCKERLPKENDWYLITARYKGTYTVDGCYWNGTEWLMGDFTSVKEFDDEIEILAWQPLPPKYEG